MSIRRHVFAGVSISLLLAGSLGANAARAQVLADKVPADALLYAGWAGSDALGPAYNASHLKAFLESLNLPTLVDRAVSQGLARQTNPQQAQQARTLLDLLDVLAKSPTALYVGPLDIATNPAQPAPRIALFSKVGKDAAARFAPLLNVGLQRNRLPGQPDAAAVAAGDFLLLYVGDADLQNRLTGAAPAARTLADVDAFKKSLAHLGPTAANAAATVYFDGHAAVEMLAAGIQAQPNLQARQLYPALADGLGLNALQQYAWAGSFDGAGWQAASFLGLGERRPGLLAFFDNPPLSQESLKLIPQSATSAGAFRFDGLRLLNDASAIAGKISEQAPRQIETALKDVFIWTGVDFKNELLPGFGSEFIYYGSPEAAGDSLHGFVLANRLRDPKKAQSAAAALVEFTNALVAQQIPESKLQFQSKTLAAPFDKVTAHTLALPNFNPAWAVHNDVFFFAFSLPALQSALEMTTPGKPTILDNPRFTALRRKLGQESFASFSFADLPGSARETYAVANQIMTTILAQNPNLQPIALPPLNKITPTLAPAMAVRWSDAQGYHSRETSPFPLAGYLSPGSYTWLLVADQINKRAQTPVTTPATPATPALPGGGLP